MPGQVRLGDAARVRFVKKIRLLFFFILLLLGLLGTTDEVGMGLVKGLHKCFVFKNELGQGMGLSCQLLGVFEGTFQDEPGHRVDVHGCYLAPQPHRLQRDRAATGEGVEHLRRPATVGPAYFLAEPLQSLFVLRLPTPVENATFGDPFLPFDGLAAWHLFLFDGLESLTADLFTELPAQPDDLLLPLFIGKAVRLWLSTRIG